MNKILEDFQLYELRTTVCRYFCCSFGDWKLRTVSTQKYGEYLGFELGFLSLFGRERATYGRYIVTSDEPKLMITKSTMIKPSFLFHSFLIIGNSVFSYADDIVDHMVNFAAANIQRSRVGTQYPETLSTSWIPAECEHSYSHHVSNGLFYDELTCANWCGEGNHFIVSALSYAYPDGTLGVVADCRIPSCTSCAVRIGGCPCPVIASFESACTTICGAPSLHLSESVNDATSNSISSISSDTPSTVPSDAPSSTPSYVPSFLPS